MDMMDGNALYINAYSIVAIQNILWSLHGLINNQSEFPLLSNDKDDIAG